VPAFRQLLIAACLVILPALNAHALSIGPYVDFSGGSGAYEWDSYATETEFNMGSFAIGFSLDTAATDESWFNYRLNVGLESQTFDEDNNNDATTDVSGFTIENIFGFAIRSEPGFRWWAGPLLRFGAYHGESGTYNLFGTPYKTELDLVESGLGLVTGVNIKVGGNMLLAPSLGVRSLAAAGTVSIANQNTSSILIDENLSGHSSNFFLNFALLF